MSRRQPEDVLVRPKRGTVGLPASELERLDHVAVGIPRHELWRLEEGCREVIGSLARLRVWSDGNAYADDTVEAKHAARARAGADSNSSSLRSMGHSGDAAFPE